MNISASSARTASEYRSTSPSVRAAYTVVPGSTPARSGEATLSPAAAFTLSTPVNLSRGSRISSSGLGSRMALGLATMTPSRRAITMRSVLFSWPSISIMLAVSPSPVSWLASSTIPRVPFSSCSSRAAMYCWVRATRTVSSSGMPTPVRADMGIMETSDLKSLTR